MLELNVSIIVLNHLLPVVITHNVNPVYNEHSYHAENCSIARVRYVAFDKDLAVKLNLC